MNMNMNINMRMNAQPILLGLCVCLLPFAFAGTFNVNHLPADRVNAMCSSAQSDYHNFKLDQTWGMNFRVAEPMPSACKIVSKISLFDPYMVEVVSPPG